jgi:hypothetical protein
MENVSIQELYRGRYGYVNFYERISHRIAFNKSNGLPRDFGHGITFDKIECKPGEIRVDLPVSLGLDTAIFRIAILGLEPRDSHWKYNIERITPYVFAAPFGIDRWTEGNKYYKSFNGLINRDDCYLYFTDVVKEYEVKDSKRSGDIHARKEFWKKASNIDNIKFLREEMELIKPTHIVALGRYSYRFLKANFGNIVYPVTHPNARQNRHTKENAWDLASRQLQDMLVDDSVLR